MDLIEGKISIDRGTVRRLRRLTISRLTQMPQFKPQETVLQTALQVFHHLRSWERRLRDLEAEMSFTSGALTKALSEEYGELRERFEAQGGYQYRARTQAALHGLGLGDDRLTQPCANLSGGEKRRLLLAQAVLRPVDLLLLDEPTNHLDLNGILWLVGFLQSLQRSYVLVSHDRYLLDKVTNRTWEIESKRLYDYPAPYTRSRQLRSQRWERDASLYRKQQEWKNRTEEFIQRNLAGQKTKQAQSRRKRLEKTRWLEKPQVEKELEFEIPEAERGPAVTLSLPDTAFGYAGNQLIGKVELILQRGERVGILGGNGSGKTTFFRTLLGEIPALAGEVQWGINLHRGYFSQNPEAGKGTVYDALRELDPHCSDRQLLQLAALFLFTADQIKTPVGALSGGQKSRLALARLFLHPTNLLLLDEPTNFLDIPSREGLEKAPSKLPRHSPGSFPRSLSDQKDHPAILGYSGSPDP